MNSHILVVDDSPVARRIISRELELGGYTVVEASSGAEALQQVKTNAPALITLDVNMSGMNGFDTCIALREQIAGEGDGTHIPVIFITSMDTVEGRERGFEVGGTAFITKPFQQGELLERVGGILGFDRPWKDALALVVEDSEIAKMAIADTLSSQGIKSVAVGNAQAGLEKLKANPREFSLVICDYFLPGMMGDEFCQEVRKDPEIKEIPIVMLSAGTDRSNILKMFKAGATDYVNKPFVQEELVARIEVHLRAHMLTQSLREQISEAHRLSEAKTKMLSITSHDLRTPINTMKGYFELLMEEGNTPEDKVDFAKQFRRANDLMLTIIDNLSTVGKALSTERSLNPGPVLVGDVVRSSLITYEQEAIAKGVTLKMEPESPGEVVVGDSNSLVRVFDNLISNSIKFSPSGGMVTISVTKESPSCCEIKVIDKGKGMTPEELDVIFDVYSRATGQAAGHELGGGVGLPVCKHLVEKLNGSLKAESVVGEGSVFTLKLPMYEES